MYTNQQCHTKESSLRDVLQLLLNANVVPSSLILFTLMMLAIHSSETSVPSRATWRRIPEDGTLHRHRCGNLKSYEIHRILSFNAINSVDARYYIVR
jgi:hypothetical protein